MQNEYMLVVDNSIERQRTVVGILKRLRALQPGLPEPKVLPTPDEAIAFSSGHACPVIFAAVPLPGMSSFSMIEQIRKQNNRTNFILLTDQKEYIIQALTMKLRLSGSIMGMPDMEMIQNELDNLWFPLSS